MSHADVDRQVTVLKKQLAELVDEILYNEQQIATYESEVERLKAVVASYESEHRSQHTLESFIEENQKLKREVSELLRNQQQAQDELTSVILDQSAKLSHVDLHPVTVTDRDAQTSPFERESRAVELVRDSNETFDLVCKIAANFGIHVERSTWSAGTASQILSAVDQSNAKVSAFAAENDALREEARRWRASISEMQEEMKGFKREVEAAAAAQRDDLSFQVKDLEMQLALERKQREQTQRMLSAEQSARLQLDAVMNASLQTESTIKIRELSSKILELESSLSDASMRREQELSRKEAQAAATESELQTRIQHLENRLEADRSSAEMERSTLHQKLRDAMANASKIETVLQEKISELRVDSVKSLDTETAKRLAQHAVVESELKERIRLLEARMLSEKEEFDSERSSLQARLQESLKMETILREKISEVKLDFEQLQPRRAQESSEADLNEKIRHVEARLALERDAFESEKAMLRNRLQVMETESSKVETGLREKISQLVLDGTRNSEEALAAKAREFQTLEAGLRDTIGRLEAELRLQTEDAEATRSALEHHVSSLQEEVTQMNASICEKSMLIESMEKSTVSHQDVECSLSDKIEHLERQLAERDQTFLDLDNQYRVAMDQASEREFALQENISQLQAEIDQNVQLFRDLEQQLAHESTVETELRMRIQDLERKLAGAESRTQSQNSSEVTGLQLRIADLESTLLSERRKHEYETETWKNKVKIAHNEKSDRVSVRERALEEKELSLINQERHITNLWNQTESELVHVHDELRLQEKRVAGMEVAAEDFLRDMTALRQSVEDATACVRQFAQAPASFFQNPSNMESLQRFVTLLIQAAEQSDVRGQVMDARLQVRLLRDANAQLEQQRVYLDRQLHGVHSKLASLERDLRKSEDVLRATIRERNRAELQVTKLEEEIVLLHNQSHNQTLNLSASSIGSNPSPQRSLILERSRLSLSSS
eukprot:ANDGO_06765.mRNA.1 hypothetical protein